MFGYEDEYMDKLAGVMESGVAPEEAYCALEDAETIYADAMDKLAAAEEMYADAMEKIAYAEELYGNAEDYLGYYEKLATEYVALPQSALNRAATAGAQKVRAVRAGEPGSEAVSPLEDYAAATREC